MPVRVVEGVVQHYDWGDTEFIPKLLGRPGRGEPWAELWLGTHPNGPATLDDGTPLSDLTGSLPYLLKVLSAAQPLSLQAHPSTEEAAAGYADGVFADDQSKPELIVALTDFEAFCGIRPAAKTAAMLRAFGADNLAEGVATQGPFETMSGLYRGSIDARPFIDACADRAEPEAVWVTRLDQMYPNDASVAVSMLLNYVRLQPGEALHLTAGNLHGYLRGSGIELMRASDNVVRGGLTSKHVDLDLLLATVDPTPLLQPVMHVSDGRYPLPEAGVALVRLDPGSSHSATGHELAIALDGAMLYLSPGTQIYADTVTFVVVPT